MAKSGRRSGNRNQPKKARNQTKKSRTQRRRPTKNSKNAKKPAKKGSKKMNDYMIKKEHARKHNLDEFVYKGNTYVRGAAKTGMVIYSKK